jgi:uncharacterized protein with PIN domain
VKFILTKELGRLARWLRILGYDTVYQERDDKPRLVILSLRDERIILTRDAKMSRFTGIRMVRIDDDAVEKQLEQVVRELGLAIDKERTFLRCVDCNDMLVDVAKEKVEKKVPPYVYTTQDEFKTCPACQKVFWRGTHGELVKKFLADIDQT